MDYKIVYCQKCKGELHIPAELSSCICMYCGEKLFLNERKHEKEVTPEEARDNYEKALGNISLLVKEHERIITSFTRNQYSSGFENYGKSVDQLLLSMEQYAALPDVNSTHIIQEITEKLLNYIDEDIKHTKGFFSGSSNAKRIDQYRFFMTIYLVPMIRYRKLEISEPLSDCIISEWRKRYPKYEFKKASYEEIAKGFERKGFCFISSAVCDSMGKSDDCYELTTFRNFRDTYMQQSPHGRKLISQYYELAPIIVAYINLCLNKESYYEFIWRRYLSRCLRAIEEKDYSACEKYYINMVADLRKKVPFDWNTIE
jgi:hypothetical protein